MRLLISFLCILLFIACSAPERPDARVRIEKVNGKSRFLIDGKVHEIRGVSGYTYLKEAAHIGANTIRSYDTTDLQRILDSAALLNLKVVAGIWLPQSEDEWFTKDLKMVSEAAQSLANLGRRFSDHPALLSWCLGHELYFNRLSSFHFAAVYRELMDSLRSGDPHHLIGTAFANFEKKKALNFGIKIPDLDYYLVNTFARLEGMGADMANLDPFWSRPFLVGEFGEFGPWETKKTAWGAPLEPYSHRKAEVLSKQYKSLPEDNPNYLGALAFYWGWRQEQTYTWYNVFSPRGAVNAQYFTLAERFGNPQPGFAPRVDTLLIDGSGNTDKFWFKAGSTHWAEVKVDSNFIKDSVEISWNLRAEDWFFLRSNTSPPLQGYFKTSTESQKIQFQCPKKPGPFRLFVELRDQSGHFATANLPFYVVQD